VHVGSLALLLLAAVQRKSASKKRATAGEALVCQALAGAAGGVDRRAGGGL